MAGSRKNTQRLVVRLRPDKTVVWCNRLNQAPFRVDDHDQPVPVSSTITVVGIVIGEDAGACGTSDRESDCIGPTTGVVAISSALLARQWRTKILPQAVYGCEVRNVTREHRLDGSRQSCASSIIQRHWWT